VVDGKKPVVDSIDERKRGIIHIAATGSQCQSAIV